MSSKLHIGGVVNIRNVFNQQYILLYKIFYTAKKQNRIAVFMSLKKTFYFSHGKLTKGVSVQDNK